MNNKLVEDYRLKEELKKQLDKIILESGLSRVSLIEMLEELICLYKD